MNCLTCMETFNGSTATQVFAFYLTLLKYIITFEDTALTLMHVSHIFPPLT